jgi:hypothetical protein
MSGPVVPFTSKVLERRLHDWLAGHGLSDVERRMLASYLAVRLHADGYRRLADDESPVHPGQGRLIPGDAS